MERAITGFHCDEVGDWVAHLSCGHRQHVRHDPPFRMRPWVETHEGRCSRLGTPLECPLCDRAELPEGLGPGRRTPSWDEHSLPAGLRRDHRLAEGTWAILAVESGRARFTARTEPPLDRTLETGDTQPVPRTAPAAPPSLHPRGRPADSVPRVPEDAAPAPSRPAGAPGAATALFEHSGTDWIPTDLARGPWSPDTLHGGPVAALLAAGIERCEPTTEAQVVRLTVELLRPVPVAPLALEARLARAGRTVQHLDARLSVAASGQEVARARAVRIRILGSPPPQLAAPSVSPAPGAPGAPAPPACGRAAEPVVHGYTAFHTAGAELRFVDGGWASLGPSRVWVRLAAPVTPDEVPSPLQRAAAAADFGNGVSAVVAMDEHLFINPDLTVYLERPPVGEWVCLDAATRLGTPGIGLAQSLLWDERGVIGRSLQSLVLEARRRDG